MGDGEIESEGQSDPCEDDNPSCQALEKSAVSGEPRELPCEAGQTHVGDRHENGEHHAAHQAELVLRGEEVAVQCALHEYRRHDEKDGKRLVRACEGRSIESVLDAKRGPRPVPPAESVDKSGQPVAPILDVTAKIAFSLICDCLDREMRALRIRNPLRVDLLVVLIILQAAPPYFLDAGEDLGLDAIEAPCLGFREVLLSAPAALLGELHLAYDLVFVDRRKDRACRQEVIAFEELRDFLQHRSES